MSVNPRVVSKFEAPAPSKAASFRAELTSPELSFLMEAHSGLSAKIVEKTGFESV